MRTRVRPGAWIILGIVAIPAALLGLFELVGVVYVPLVVVLGLLIARWRRLDHLITVITLILLAACIVGTAHEAAERRHDPTGWFIARSLLWTSIGALTIAAAKLGRKAGHEAWDN